MTARTLIPKALSEGEDKYAPRLCGVCNISFRPKRVGKRHRGFYCSRDCSTAAKRKPAQCLGCGKSFYSTWGRKHCSRECCDFAGQNNPSWNGGKIKQRCLTCGVEYERFPSLAGAYCSKKCASDGLRGKQVGAKNPNFSGGEEVPCVVCGKKFWKCPGRNQVFCSNRCFHQARFGPSAPRASRSKWGATSAKSGKREDLGIFVRSSWEANYARYLNWLKVRGEIVGWGYEIETFEFTAIKRGTRFYTPDFKVELRVGYFEFHEVKGWMHPKGKTALDRMARYYPEVKIILIQQKQYLALCKSVGKLIRGWE